MGFRGGISVIFNKNENKSAKPVFCAAYLLIELPYYLNSQRHIGSTALYNHGIRSVCRAIAPIR